MDMNSNGSRNAEFKSRAYKMVYVYNLKKYASYYISRDILINVSM